MLRTQAPMRYRYLLLALTAWWLFWLGWIIARQVRQRHRAGLPT